MKITDLLLTRGDGTLYFESFAWPGGYPIIYFDKHNSVLCLGCATKEYEKFLWDDIAFPPVDADVFYEGESEFCAECNCEIESSYGVPDNSDSEEN